MAYTYELRSEQSVEDYICEVRGITRAQFDQHNQHSTRAAEATQSHATAERTEPDDSDAKAADEALLLRISAVRNNRK